jgi:hypothetical protein
MRRLLLPSLVALLVACGGAPPDGPETGLTSAQHTSGSSSSPCAACIVDLSVTRTPGPPNTLMHGFAADPARRYRLTIDVPAGGSPTWFVLNGDALLTPDTMPPGAGPVVVDDLALPASNTLTVRIAGVPGRIVRVRIEPLDTGELASCPPWSGEVEPLFNDALVALEELVAIQPLGKLNPPGHTLPTHHTYWDGGTVFDAEGRPLFTRTLNVRAPGPMRLVALQYSAEIDDFKVILRPCLEVQLYVDHVKRLAPAVQAAYETARRYDFPGGTAAVLDMPLATGDPIGSGGSALFDPDGRPTSATGIDVGLIDLRRPEKPFANPDRYRLPDAVEGILPPGIPPGDVALIVRDFPPQRLYQFCPLDYFAPPLAESYRALLGSFDGTTRRTIEPRCGDLMQDVPGTLQGSWFEDKPANGLGPDFSNDGDESRLLAFAPDNVDPTRLTFSIGEGVEQPVGSPIAWTLPAGTYVFGAPRTEGTVNRAFADVTPGATHCYEDLAPPFSAAMPLAGVVLIEVSATELWIARLPSPSCEFVDPTLRLSEAAAGRRYVR